MSNTNTIPSVFSFQSINVCAFADDNGEPWFCANDVCEILGYANPRDAIAKHCHEKGVAKRDTLTEKGKQEMTFISEGNLYRLIIRSKKPEAEKFEVQVMEEILPAIRKTGSYTLPTLVNPFQQNTLQQIVASKSDESGKIRAYIWSQFNNHFQLGSYKQLPSERFNEAVSYLINMPVKAIKQNAHKPYNYPRKLLEQPGFAAKGAAAPLNVSMLGNTRCYISPLMALLNDLRADGHDIEAPWDEAIALREGIQHANHTLEEISIMALKGMYKPASTSGN